MKTAPFAVMALAMALSSPRSDAATLEPGQTIGVDFGATTPTNNFNQVDPNTPGSLVNGSIPKVIDTNGTILASIGVRFDGENLGSSEATAQDLPNDKGFVLSNIEDGMAGENIRIIFSGLTPGQHFTCSAVSSFSPRNIGTEFVWESVHIQTNSQSTTGGTLAYFSNIIADPSGLIVITATGHDSQYYYINWAGINAIYLTVKAVPEPSTWVLCLGGVAGLVLTQRLRRAAKGNSVNFAGPK